MKNYNLFMISYLTRKIAIKVNEAQFYVDNFQDVKNFRKTLKKIKYLTKKLEREFYE